MGGTSRLDKGNRILELMSRLVAINSVFPGEGRLVNFIEAYLQQLRFSVERVPAEPGRDNLVAVYGQNQKFLCLYGHVDTVPPDPAWKQNPFLVTIAGGVARGLGVADMKGGLAVILLAAKYAYQHRRPIKLAFGVDEENISLGSYTLTKTRFFNNVNLLISAESGQIVNESQDYSVNYGRKGRFVIEVAIEGVAAHAARSDLATNAITQTARFLMLADQLNLPKHSRLGQTEIIPFFIESQTDSFSIPSRSVLRLNVLTVPGVTSSHVIEQLEKLCRQERIQAAFQLVQRITPYMEAYEVDRRDSNIQLLENKIFSQFKVIPGYAASVADENRFANELGIPVISIGPIGGHDHTANEWVNLSSLRKTLIVYQKIINLL